MRASQWGAWAVVVVLAVSQAAGAQETTRDVFRPVREQFADGVIDWEAGIVDGYGRGDAPNVETALQSVRRRPLEGEGQYRRRLDQWRRDEARRAAERVALENALRIMLGVAATADVEIQDLEMPVRQRVTASALDNYRLASERWVVTTTQPYAEITVSIPLWGPGSPAGVIWQELVRQADEDAQERRPAVRLNRVRRLLVDARERDMRPVMFPMIVDTDGAVIFDVNSLVARQPGDWGPIRFVTTDQPSAAFTAVPLQEAPYRYVRTQGPSGDDSNKGAIVLSADAASQLTGNPVALELMRRGLVTIIVKPRQAEEE